MTVYVLTIDKMQIGGMVTKTAGVYQTKEKAAGVGSDLCTYYSYLIGFHIKKLEVGHVPTLWEIS